MTTENAVRRTAFIFFGHILSTFFRFLFSFYKTFVVLIDSNGTFIASVFVWWKNEEEKKLELIYLIRSFASEICSVFVLPSI